MFGRPAAGAPVFSIGLPADGAARLVSAAAAAAADEVPFLPLVREERLNRLFVEGGDQLAHFVLEDVVVANEVDWGLPLRDRVVLVRVPERRLQSRFSTWIERRSCTALSR